MTKKGRAKPAEKHAIMEVPPIVTVAEFEAVQRSLVKGKTGCPGVTLPMDQLNAAVVKHLETRLLDPARLAVLMDQILARRDELGKRAPPACR